MRLYDFTFDLVVAISLVFIIGVYGQPVITSIASHQWSPSEINFFETNGVCRVDGYDLTVYEGTNPQDQWCCWATSGQVTIAATNLVPTNDYVIRWLPWSPIASVRTNGLQGPSWMSISPPLSPNGSSLSFTTGIIESSGYFRVEKY